MKNLIIFILVLSIITFVIITYFYNNKTSETNQINSVNILSENIIKNALPENTLISNEITTSDEIISSTKTVKYEFTSADNMAAQGNPGILKIVELNNDKIEFEYNHGWNFTESTIDREILGIAEINSGNLYEFNESVDGHEYSITFNVSEEMVTLSEYIDGELLSIINLWA